MMDDPFNPYSQTGPFVFQPIPSPRTMPVNVPFSIFGITVVTMDSNGNITIKVDQPIPEKENP